MPKERINWPAERARYVASDTLSYEQMAKELGVALSTIGRKAGPEKWPELRLKRQEDDADAALREMRRRNRRSYIERNEVHTAQLRIGQNALVKAIMDGVAEPRSLENTVRALCEAIKAERLVLGETTERVEEAHSEDAPPAEVTHHHIIDPISRTAAVLDILRASGAIETGAAAVPDAEPAG